MTPCPRCHGTTSLQELKLELSRLEHEKKSREWFAAQNSVSSGGSVPLAASNHTRAGSGGNITITGGAGGSRDAPPEPWTPELEALDHSHGAIHLAADIKPTTCAKCGHLWVPDAPEQAKSMIERIRALKCELGPVEAIADLARKEL